MLLYTIYVTGSLPTCPIHTTDSNKCWYKAETEWSEMGSMSKFVGNYIVALVN